MDHIYINDHKLKIMLTDKDMKKYSLDAGELDYNNKETRGILWDILSEATENTDFETDGGKIFIQLYPSKEGGCEMYVTKLGGASNNKESANLSSKKTAEGKRECAYSFDSLEALLSVCRRLSSLGYSDKSSAWRVFDKYYLLINEPEENAYIPLSECSFIREYGKSESARHVKLLISERAACICPDNAIDTLACF